MATTSSIDSGAMDRRIQYVKEVESQSTAGRISLTRQVVGTDRAHKMYKSVDESMTKAPLEVSTAMVYWYVRYRRNLQITSGMIIVELDTGDEYAVEGEPVDDGRRQILQIATKRVD